MDNLELMVEIYQECRYRGMFTDCEGECPLSKPIHEESEHPTFCETLYDLDQRWNAEEEDIGFTPAPEDIIRQQQEAELP